MGNSLRNISTKKITPEDISTQNISTMRLTIVGAGRLGQTLGRLIVQNQVFPVEQVVCRTICSAQESVDFIGQGRAVSNLKDLSRTELVCIAVPDDSIVQVAQELAKQFASCPPWGAFHCSGASSAEVLAPLEDIGVKGAALHPVFSFASPATAINEFSDVYFALDGEEELLTVLEQAVIKLQCKSFRIRSEDKALYHAANVVLSNLLVTLVHQGLSLYQAFGVSEDEARKIVSPLIDTCVKNISLHGTSAALTGPVVRGDHDTIAKHLSALESASSLTRNIYRQLSLASVELAKLGRQGPCSQLEAIAEILENSKSTGE